ncbi:hypothetical protein GCM10009559_04490 [Pseudonocardia zijingensis]|uniref:Uncharacterized protein n=1 Tax=Pseudonocardia zijingensis TaxID=153376 RepID=A0ABP3ZJK1_9PSEU
MIGQTCAQSADEKSRINTSAHARVRAAGKQVVFDLQSAREAKVPRGNRAREGAPRKSSGEGDLRSRAKRRRAMEAERSEGHPRRTVSRAREGAPWKGGPGGEAPPGGVWGLHPQKTKRAR